MDNNTSVHVFKLFYVILGLWFLLLVVGCAGLGLEKKCTMVPDSIKTEIDIDPSDCKATRYRIGAGWNLK